MSDLIPQAADSPAPSQGPATTPVQDAALPPDPAEYFYQIDNTKIPLAEFWRVKPWSLLILIAAILKLLRIRIPCSTDDPPVVSLDPFQVEAVDVPADIQQQFEPALRDLAECGFEHPIYHVIHDDLHRTDTYFASLVHASGQAWARVHHSILRLRHPPKRIFYTEIFTPFSDGTCLWSLAAKPDLQPPLHFRINRHPAAKPAELWQSHQELLKTELAGRAIAHIASPEQLPQAIETLNQAVTEFQVRRGVFVPLSEADRRQLDQLARQRAAAGPDGLEHAEVLTELNKLENKQGGWTRTLLILFVSLLLFVALTALSWTWEFLLLIIPILFFHELGHYLAMRLFRYRNVRMFFIPFFGAAVSGQSYSAPGWKKVVVALMGPLPGIVLGAVLGLVGVYLHNALLVKISLLTLILNGFNLLPIFPLDGGQIMHTLLFRRHYALDAAFRALAAGVLICGGVLLHDKLLLYFGIFMVVTVPAAFRLGRVAHELIRSGFQPGDSHETGIPIAAAQTIIGKLKAAFPKKTANKTLARLTLQTYESIAARRVGWPATLGLGTLHGLGLIAALIFAGVIMVAQNGGLHRLARLHIPQPTHSLAVNSITTWQGPDAIEYAPDGRSNLIAMFDDEPRALRAFEQLRPQLPPNAIMERFGQSLILSLPASDDVTFRKWHQQMQQQTQQLFVDDPSADCILSLSCAAPDEAKAKQIREETFAYFSLPMMHLIPPWSPADSRSPQQRQQHAAARRTYLELAALDGQVDERPEMQALMHKFEEAYAKKDQDQIQRLQAQSETLAHKLWLEQAEQLRRRPGQDVTVIDRYSALYRQNIPYPQFVKRLTPEIGPALGQLPLQNGKPTPQAARYSTVSGVPVAKRSQLTFYWLQFEDVAQGAPALVRWLQSQGCADFKYDVAAVPGRKPRTPTTAPAPADASTPPTTRKMVHAAASLQ